MDFINCGFSRSSKQRSAIERLFEPHLTIDVPPILFGLDPLSTGVRATFGQWSYFAQLFQDRVLWMLSNDHFAFKAAGYKGDFVCFLEYRSKTTGNISVGTNRKSEFLCEWESIDSGFAANLHRRFFSLFHRGVSLGYSGSFSAGFVTETVFLRSRMSFSISNEFQSFSKLFTAVKISPLQFPWLEIGVRYKENSWRWLVGVTWGAFRAALLPTKSSGRSTLGLGISYKLES